MDWVSQIEMLGDIIDLTMPDPDDEQTHSEADLATIGDVTVWHMMPHLPARRLIQLNCERWSVWNPSHKARIATARRLDDSRDWYFPIITKRWIPKPGEIIPPERCWTWSGIWHESSHHAHTARALTLPPMTYLRQDWRYASFMLDHIVASEGGLLLIWSRKKKKEIIPRQKKEIIPRRRSPRLNKPVAETNVPNTSAPEWRTANGSNGSDQWENVSPYWTRLLVCNPLTKEYRELPAANCEDMGWQSWRLAYYESVQVRMVVDDEANSYQVILLLKNFVAVYKSTTNSWNCVRLQESLPWSRRFNPPGVYCSAAVRVGERIYLADVRTNHQQLAIANAGFAALGMDPISDPTPAGTLRLFDVDAEAGTWHLLHKYTLRKFHLPVLNQDPRVFKFFDMGVVDNVELVGCMGDLYAVVPARLHDVVTVGQKQTTLWKNELRNLGTRGWKRKNSRSFELKEPELAMPEVGVEYMPLVFYVMQLRAGDGVDHAVLRIDVPEIWNVQDFRDYMTRKQRMYNTINVHRSGGPSLFNCEARGSVIWVSYEDYLLSYDVVSRKSTTQMIQVDISYISANHVARLAYRPSFHMKP